ncbi:MAG: TonB-dependent receptor, partial [Gammaproteobacteria bacterium]|nr:TonB-dependent receptor [Gammaproteobacteria bacterium]
SIGAHGFAGFSPPQAGLWGRSNIAVYGDMEADITDNLTAGFAVRYEDFESFGDTTNYKLAVRYVFTEDLSARASFSTGFRAPTPGQDNVTKVSTRTVDGELQQSGQIPAGNAIAQALGAEVLKPEGAKNISIGSVWNVTEELTITADWFRITMEDRIGLTGLTDITALAATDAQFDSIACPNAKAADSSLAVCLQEIGVPGAADLAQVQFYTNDFATTTTGFDIVASMDVDLGEIGDGNFAIAWNHTKTEVDDAGSEVSRNKVVDLENYNPHDRATFTYNHFIGDWRLLARVSYYADWVEAGWSDDPSGAGTNYTIDCQNTNDPDVNRDNCYSGASLLDLEASYTFNDNYSITVGASNALNKDAPLDIDNHDNTYSGSGTIYTNTSPWGFDGAFYYVRVRATF